MSRLRNSFSSLIDEDTPLFSRIVDLALCAIYGAVWVGAAAYSKLAETTPARIISHKIDMLSDKVDDRLGRLTAPLHEKLGDVSAFWQSLRDGRREKKEMSTARSEYINQALQDVRMQSHLEQVTARLDKLVAERPGFAFQILRDRNNPQQTEDGQTFYPYLRGQSGQIVIETNLADPRKPDARAVIGIGPNAIIADGFDYKPSRSFNSRASAANFIAKAVARRVPKERSEPAF